jgi:hypothetical protein
MQRAKSSLIAELLIDKPREPKTDRPRPVRPSLQQFLADHPINARDALARNVAAFEAYEREQAKASRSKTFRPTYQQPNAERKVA